LPLPIGNDILLPLDRDSPDHESSSRVQLLLKGYSLDAEARFGNNLRPDSVAPMFRLVTYLA
jgi:hypothetical protein